MNFLSIAAKAGRRISRGFGSTARSRLAMPHGSTNDSVTVSPEPQADSALNQTVFEDLLGKGGRSPKYDWQGLNDKIAELYNSDDPPASHAACARQVVRWMEALELEPPDEDYLRLRISKFLRKSFPADQKNGPDFAIALQEAPPIRYRLRLAIVFAAALLAGGVGGWFLYLTTVASEDGWETIVQHAAVAHMAYAPRARYKAQMPAEDQAALIDRLSQRLDASIDPPGKIVDEEDYWLVGGRWLAGRAGSAAQFMYADTQGSRMSLYITARPPGSAADIMYIAELEGVGVSYWCDGTLAYVIAGDLAEIETLEIWRTARGLFATSGL